MTAKKILMVNIATNKYVQFLDDLYDGVKKNFLTDHDVSFLLFTNHDEALLNLKHPVKVSKIEHKPFPEPTLKRYNYFMQEREYIEQFDYVFYSDVDMGFIAPVGEEVLSDLSLTLHILTYKGKNYYSYERRPQSTAFIPEGKGEYYFAGGFNGGSSKKFMEMSEVIANNVLEDEKNGIVAEWHDESHLNRYAIDNPPTNILPLAYCCPDWKEQLNFDEIQPKILALNKNHEEIRA